MFERGVCELRSDPAARARLLRDHGWFFRSLR